eukprot:TRINITY_DN17963_c0_g1_i1.p1 TRINITY_DN17963_c0_g1~~TRINITY_DN17963_c0_g1_i1.p1  ORF type:complete len:383 (-),score=86.40 TRINITY_DN17963_c0_g1_i1:140-1180(-)
MDAARAMLDALMGPGRDVKEKDKEKAKERFKDARVCKSYLVGLCPFDPLYLGGKRKFKPCEKTHSEMMVDLFKAHADRDKLTKRYELDGIPLFEQAVRECDARINEEKKRIIDEWAKKDVLDKHPQHIKDKLATLKVESSARLHLAENLPDSNVDQKRRLMKEADELTKEATAIEKEENVKAEKSEPTDKVCPVCATCFKGPEGSESDAAHKLLRIHIIYSDIRARLVELKEKAEKAEAEKAEEAEKEKERGVEKEKRVERRRVRKKREDSRARSGSGRREKSKKRERSERDEEGGGGGRSRRGTESKERSRGGEKARGREEPRSRGRRARESRSRSRGGRGRGRD